MKKTVSFRRWILVSLSMILCIFLTLPVFAEGTQTAAQSQPVFSAVLGKININSKSYAQFENVSVQQGTTGNITAFAVSITNGGSQNLSLSDYFVSVASKSGIAYTAQLVSQDKNNPTTVSPGTTQTYHFYATVDTGTTVNDLVFTFIKWDFSKPNFETVLGKISVPENYSSTGTVNDTYHYTNDSGTYTINFTSLNRLPWKDQDILTATFTVSNTGKQTLPIPNFTGYFKLDNTVKVDATTINADHVITLQPGNHIQIQLQGKIPYSNSINTAEIFVQNVDGSGTSAAVSDVLHVSIPQIATIPSVETNSSYVLNHIGGKWSFTVDSVDTFSSDTDNNYSVQLGAQNLEKRSIPVTNLVAQFKSSDGTIFPANITSISSNILPQEKAELSVWGTFPKNYDTTKLQLIVGEAVTGNHLTQSGEQADSLVKTVSYQLPSENVSVQSDLNNVNLFPYKLSITDVHYPSFFYNKGTSNYDVSLSFDYNLQRNLFVEKNMDNNNYVVELEDANGEVLLSQVLDFDNGVTTANPPLQLGTHSIQLNASMNNSSFNTGKYTIKIYHQFQSGHKKLLASQSL